MIRKSKNNADKETEYEERRGDGGERGNKREGGRKGVLVHPSLFSIFMLIQFCIGLTRETTYEHGHAAT